jgi:hypothetical protein
LIAEKNLVRKTRIDGRWPPTIVAANHFLKSRETAVMPNREDPAIGHSITRFERRYKILSDR